jgi:predicted nuclease of predicted toxin-antitoxin system
MRVLLDECVPRRLRVELAEHVVSTVGDLGWSGLKNGALLAKAAAEFDCFLTVDKNLQFQQHTAELPISVLVLHAPNNKYETLRHLMPQARDALRQLRPNQVVRVGA